jgi:hypothetical protein
MVLTKERVQAVVNSSARLNPLTETTGDFTWSFNNDVTRVSDILIKAVQIPYSFYSINSSNNYILINATTITITSGNYTATSLIPELISKIDTALGGTTTITYSTQTLKFTINHSANIQITNNGAGTSPLAALLGYSTTTAAATSHTATQAANISGPNYIRVVSEFLTKPIHHKTLYANDTLATTLLVVPVHAGYGDIITTEPEIPVRLSYKLAIKSTDIIDFTLKDEFNNTVDLNGLNWSMQIVFLTE